MKVEEISTADGVLGYLIATAEGEDPGETTFVTRPEANLQVGFVVKDVNNPVPRHKHKPIERAVVGTAEVLVVTRGGGEIDFFDERGTLAESKRFGEGDVLVLLGGGHELRFHEHTVLLEVKQGPYPGVDEKDLF